MQTTLECIPCILRQSLEAARNVSDDAAIHEMVMKKALTLAAEMDLRQSPPEMTQYIHRHLRNIIGDDDPYREAKQKMNRLALAMLPSLREKIANSPDPIFTATRLSIAGNVIDFGVNGNLDESDVILAMEQTFQESFFGEYERFKLAVQQAQSILYLTDNAGEIAFDRLLIEQILPKEITVVVRGAPVINDNTYLDAQAVGLDSLVKVIDNGSDAPGTILKDCSEHFLSHYQKADLIIAKGQGNYESLNQEKGNLWFLFRVKCPVVARLTRQPMNTHMLIHG